MGLKSLYLEFNGMELNFESRKSKRRMGLNVHHGGFKPVDSLEWRSATPSMR
jgi:hypothetical protein